MSVVVNMVRPARTAASSRAGSQAITHTVSSLPVSPISHVRVIGRAMREDESGSLGAPLCEGGSRREGDEDAVVARAASGDSEAFRTLFARHRTHVARLVFRMLREPADLEDVVQEVFVQVFRSLKSFRGDAKFTTWLHRITLNVVLMHRRSARARPVLTQEIQGDSVVDETQISPDEDVERRLRVRAFQRLVARLADKKRVVFILHEFEGMSPAQIAELVEAPVLTVRTRLFYARRELEAMLGDEPSLAAFRGLGASEFSEENAVSHE